MNYPELDRELLDKVEEAERDAVKNGLNFVAADAEVE